MAKQNHKNHAKKTRHSAHSRPHRSPQPPMPADHLLNHARGTVNAVLQMQENIARSFEDFAHQSSDLLEGQRRWEEAVLDAVPSVQRGILAYADVLDRSSRTGLDWMRTTLDSRTPTDMLRQMSQVTHDFTQRSVNAMQANAQSIAEANRLVWELWNTMMNSGLEAGKAAARSAEDVGRVSAESARRAARASARKAATLAAVAAEATDDIGRTTLRATEKAA